MGGCKTYGGRKTYQRKRSPENFWTPPKELLVCSVVDFCTGKSRALTPEGGGKRKVGGGGPKPLLGGASFVRFSTPSFFHPPMASSEMLWEDAQWYAIHGTRRKQQNNSKKRTTTNISKQLGSPDSGVLALRRLLPVQHAIQENAQNLCRNIFRTSESSLPKIV